MSARHFPDDVSSDFFAGLFNDPDGARKLHEHLIAYARSTRDTWMPVAPCPPLFSLIEDLVRDGLLRMAVVGDQLLIAMTSETAVPS